MDSTNEKTYNNTIPPFGDFTFIECSWTRYELSRVFQVIKELECGWIFKYEMKSYSFDQVDPSVPLDIALKIKDCLNKISAHELMDHHSGSSYGWVMRAVESMYKTGWDTFYINYIKDLEEKKKMAEKALADKALAAMQQAKLKEMFIVACNLRNRTDLLSSAIAFDNYITYQNIDDVIRIDIEYNIIKKNMIACELEKTPVSDELEKYYRDQIIKKTSDCMAQDANVDCTAEQFYVYYKFASLNLIKEHDLQWLIANRDSFAIDKNNKMVNCYFKNTPLKWSDIVKNNLDINLDTILCN